jgi:prophage regulatory protein
MECAPCSPTAYFGHQRIMATIQRSAPRQKAQQPLNAAEVADALLRLTTVQALTGLSKTTLYSKAATGELTPIRMGKRCTRWKAGDVTAWLQAQGK